VVERAQPPIHFRRKPMIETALKGWTSERLAKAMTMLAETSLDARRRPSLAETIAQRAMMLIARSAAQRS
jgi:DNA polymerase-3 subunit delta